MVTSRIRVERRDVYRVRTAPEIRCTNSASTDSSLRRRTLASYPMDHSARDTLNSLSSQKDVLRQGRVVLTRVSQTSQDLSRRSKRLFEDALKGATGAAKPGGLPKLDTRSQSRRSGWCTPSYELRSGPGSRVPSATHSAPGCTGPTLQGSLLYADRSRLLTPPSDDTISPTPPPGHAALLAADIRLTLERSNAQYRVVTSAGSRHLPTTACSPDFSEYVLEKDVPTDNDVRQEDILSFGDPEETSTTIIAAAGRGQVAARSEISMATEECVGSPRRVVEVPAPPEPVAPPAECNPEQPRQGESRSRSLKSRRKVTWVDDVTVSSPNMEADDRETQSPRQQDDDNKAPMDGEIVQNSEEGLNVSDVQEGSVTGVLPDFICPTSEDKSREARTRHWLKDNSFIWASRSVPLI